MYNLVGIRNDRTYDYGGWTGDTIRSEVVVATFSTEEAAERYAKDSRLKSKRGYKVRSLLGRFDDHEVVCSTTEEIPPHDPVF